MTTMTTMVVVPACANQSACNKIEQHMLLPSSLRADECGMTARRRRSWVSSREEKREFDNLRREGEKKKERAPVNGRGRRQIYFAPSFASCSAWRPGGGGFTEQRLSHKSRAALSTRALQSRSSIGDTENYKPSSQSMLEITCDFHDTVPVKFASLTSSSPSLCAETFFLLFVMFIIHRRHCSRISSHLVARKSAHCPLSIVYSWWTIWRTLSLYLKLATLFDWFSACLLHDCAETCT